MIRNPALFIICGHVGAGKTTVAKKLGAILNIGVASTDTTLEKVLPRPSFEGKEVSPSKEELVICYNINALLAKYLLSAGDSIIIDGAFALKKQREQIIGVARKLHKPFFILYVTCPEELIKKRAAKRFLAGKGRGVRAYLEIKKIYQPLTERHYIIDTSKSTLPQLKSFLRWCAG